MRPIPPSPAEIHIMACNFITRLKRSRPHVLRVFFEPGEPPRLRTCRRLLGEPGAVRDPDGALPVGVYRYPTGFAAFKADLRVAIAACYPPLPANAAKLIPDVVPSRAVEAFSTALRKAQRIEAYWSPSRGRVQYRSLALTHRSPNALDAGAVMVGSFAYPCPRAVFVDALRETILTQQAAA